ncbi:AMP-binding protein [Streptomyces sp. AM 4-1-1]|uniref:AMP-binding protein n=1 Tax=Streptomyces sp. AM 4-1-1 TaxID=3028710 RepID=UPI0023B9B90F|nr:AMP-binding protein [Streptomyces sp. AM 4-1-1]WEH31980.1 AMP-binding protein [Streptomyces sp. AM 4-1-1]
MHDRLLHRFLDQPGDRAATVDLDGAIWSFDEILGRALAVAQQLRAHHQVAGRVVLLRTGPGPLFSVADLAVLLAGGVPAVLPDLTAEQLTAVWRVVDPAAVIDTTGRDSPLLADAASRAGTLLHRVDEATCRPTGTPLQWRAVARRWAGARLEQAAAVVFTSGTTGTPRAVALGDAELVRGVRAWTAQWNHRPARALSYLPVSHVAQRIMGHTLMCLYGTTVVASTPERVVEDLAVHRPDTLLGVPHVWARLAAAAHDGAAGRQLRQALAAVTTAVNGAAALDRAVAADLEHLTGLRIASAYGATETTVPAFHQVDAALPGLGRPVGISYRVTTQGELLLRGANLAAGFVDCWPHLRPVTDRDGWLRTGDLVRVDANGELHLAGRLASAFKTSRGEMISPEPVEAHLLSHPAVTAACLLGHGLPRAIALVCAPGTAGWPREQLAGLEDHLHRSAEAARRRGELPWSDLAAVRVLPDSWPDLGLVTSTGKPRRTVIADRYRHLLTLPEPARVPA